jgi:hypothetical protein
MPLVDLDRPAATTPRGDGGTGAVDLGLPEDDELSTLRETVRRLREEKDGLAQAIQRRAVIEQAKGVLMAREGLDSDAAFARLRRVSRETNRKLADVAAEELRRLGAGRVGARPGGLGATVRAVAPPRTSARPVLPRPPDEVAPGDPGLVLLESAAQQAATLQDLTQVLVSSCRWPAAPDRVTVLSITADGSLALVAWTGISSDTAARWQHIPLTVDFPAAVSARQAAPVFEDDTAEAIRRWPVLATNPTSVGTFCNLPVVVGGVAVAVLGLGWPAGTRLGGHDRRMLRAAAAAVTPRLVALLPAGGVQSVLPAAVAAGTSLERTAATVALDAVSDECVVLLPSVGEDDAGSGHAAGWRVEDLVLAWGNTTARAAAAAAGRSGAACPFGRRLSELAPHLVGSSLWRALTATADDQGTHVVSGAGWFWRADEEPQEVRTTALWNGVLASRSGRSRSGRSRS